MSPAKTKIVPKMKTVMAQPFSRFLRVITLRRRAEEETANNARNNDQRVVDAEHPILNLLQRRIRDRVWAVRAPGTPGIKGSPAGKRAGGAMRHNRKSSGSRSESERSVPHAHKLLNGAFATIVAVAIAVPGETRIVVWRDGAIRLQMWRPSEAGVKGGWRACGKPEALDDVGTSPRLLHEHRSRRVMDRLTPCPLGACVGEEV